MSLRVLLADDFPISRQGARAIVGRLDRAEIVAEVGDGMDALEAAKTLHPDLVLLDLSLPGVPGLEVARQLREETPRPKVLILTMHAEAEVVVRAFEAGADGYSLKTDDADELLKAIVTVESGRSYMSPALPERAIRAIAMKRTLEENDPYLLLSSRERQMLHLTAEGLTSREVAYRLALSPRTVETHRVNLMEKLGLKSQRELVRYALLQAMLPRP
jgi:DNA-binding NarL/FixJ family response regulator